MLSTKASSSHSSLPSRVGRDALTRTVSVRACPLVYAHALHRKRLYSPSDIGDGAGTRSAVARDADRDSDSSNADKDYEALNAADSVLDAIDAATV